MSTTLNSLGLSSEFQILVRLEHTLEHQDPAPLQLLIISSTLIPTLHRSQKVQFPVTSIIGWIHDPSQTRVIRIASSLTSKIGLEKRNTISSGGNHIPMNIMIQQALLIVLLLGQVFISLCSLFASNTNHFELL